MGAGVIDPDYTGEVKVLLINTAPHAHSIIRGDPIAQLILEKGSLPILKRVNKLSPTTREGARLWLLNYLYICLISQ